MAKHLDPGTVHRGGQFIETRSLARSGYGLCGCERPQRHEAGCLWGLNPEARVVLAAELIVHPNPPTGCLTCCSPLADRQRGQNVLWCSPGCAARWVAGTVCHG